MPKSNKVKPASESSAKCVAVTVLKKQRRYAMYELLEVDGEGAFLGGKLLLEPGESIALELAFADGRTSELDATVVSADTGERPGIRVAWISISAADRARLSNQ